MLHQDEEKCAPGKLASPHVEKTEQMRMGEGGSRSPLHELGGFRLQRVSRYELDCDFAKVSWLVFGKEYRAMV
jgi:hypothetical protein